MARRYIEGARTKKGERLFHSNRDGDPRNRQTVYREHKGAFGGSSKVNAKYDPSKRRFTK